MSAGQQRRSHTAPTSGGSAASGVGGYGRQNSSGSSGIAGQGRQSSGSSSSGWGWQLSGAGIGGHGRQHSGGLSHLHGRSASMSAAEEASFAAAQELASVMNAPAATGAGAWLVQAWAFAQTEDFDAPPPPLPPGTLPEITLADFSRYLRSVGDRLESFERSREASQQRMQQALSPEELRASQGQGLVAAMREVPAAFFQEGFDLDQAQLWEELVQVGSEEARAESLEHLSGYLDVVETHLVREIAARTDSFFDGSGYIQDVRGSCARLYQQVAELRQQMQGLKEETAAAVEASQQLQQQRANLVAALDMLRAMEGVAQAQSALQGLLPGAGGAGVGVDYAGAIDVLEVLQGVLDDEALLGLDCFKHLPEQIVQTAQAVDDLMSSEFLERTRFAAVQAVQAAILDRLRAQIAAEAAAAPHLHRRRLSSSSSASSLAPSRQLSAEESAELEGVAALRLADAAGLRRAAAWVAHAVGASTTAGQPALAGTAAARTAALTDPVAAEDAEDSGGGGGESLQEVLLPLVIGLRRMGRLPATMKDFKAASSARLKEMLSHLVHGCLEVLDPEMPPGDASHLLAAHRSTSPPREPPTVAQRLARLSGADFCRVLEAVLLATQAYLDHCTAVGAAIETILAAAQAPPQQLEAAAADSRELCGGAAEAAAGRWSKLLGGRARGSTGSDRPEGASGGSSGIRLPELRDVLELTDSLAAVVERYGQGVRGVLPLRSALQQLCKGGLDGMHARHLAKLTSLLEQEQWAAVEVPPEFQQMAADLEQKGAAAGAGPAAGPAAAAGRADGAAAAAGAAAAGSAGQAAAGPEVGSGGIEEAVGQRGAGVPRTFTITPQDGPTPGAPLAAAAATAAQPTGSAAGSAASRQPAAAAQAVLRVGGRGYHVVNTQLLLLSMLHDYLAFRDAVPAFSAEVAQRVLELLKVFNSRTCQLVLGAGAMQVSGLKSITAKHLALSCQCLDAFIALHPALVAMFTAGVSLPRRNMLAADFGRALQDYRLHHDEVCSKLVGIMRERLSANIKQLPALAVAWPSGGERPEAPPPSAFASTAAKQLHILSGALSPLLLPEELHSIFGRIGLMFSRTLAEAYELLEPHGAAWEQQLRADMQFLLNCLRNLPMDPAERDSNLERLTQLFERRFLLAAPSPGAGWGGGKAAGTPPAPPPVAVPVAERAPEPAPQQQQQPPPQHATAPVGMAAGPPQAATASGGTAAVQQALPLPSAVRFPDAMQPDGSQQLADGLAFGSSSRHPLQQQQQQQEPEEQPREVEAGEHQQAAVQQPSRQEAWPAAAVPPGSEQRGQSQAQQAGQLPEQESRPAQVAQADDEQQAGDADEQQQQPVEAPKVEQPQQQQQQVQQHVAKPPPAGEQQHTAGGV